MVSGWTKSLRTCGFYLRILSAVAASSDPLLASPVSGTFRGCAGAKMEFSISMQVE